MIVEARYHLPAEFVAELRLRPVPWGFGSLSEAVYYRTYSRLKPDGNQEDWADTVVRVVEGVISIRMDWFTNVIGSSWNMKKADKLAKFLALQIYDLKFLPPGRGLWAMGTEYVYERGSHALQNCGAVAVKKNLGNSARWLMDSLMCGVGTGFSTQDAKLKINPPEGHPVVFSVPDSKEGWAESVYKLIRSYEVKNARPVKFQYDRIRPRGTPLRGFGGTASGPSILKDLHKDLRRYLNARAQGNTSDTRLVADVMNSIGICVVSGNVRRGAEIALGSAKDGEFLDLKDFDKYPERSKIGSMSNNSVVLQSADDFHDLPDLAERIAANGEPGILNLVNVQKYGRSSERKADPATLTNPCAEQPLESFETCCLVEVFPTRIPPAEFHDVLKAATFYATTVELLRSHSSETNQVVSRNRRIGVSVSGIADWIDTTSVAHVFDTLNKGYDVVKAENARLSRNAGVSEAVRVTTVKPSGTVSLLAGVSPGVHFPVGGYVRRRMRIAYDSPVAEMLIAAGIPHEEDVVTPNTTVLEFPLHYGAGQTRSVKNVSVYEQAAIVAMLQRCWADNAVSNTLTVQPKELDQIDRVIAMFAPQVKSLSLLPDVDGGAYPQMPLERITKSEYQEMSSKLDPVDWTSLTGSDGEESAFCTDETCEI